MNQLVFMENNRPVTDSLTVAETFGKEHKHVLRDIRSLECSEEFTESNFGLSTYKDSTGRNLSKYIITEQGFAFLVMGYTGKEAARFKEMYISEFTKMREHLSDPYANLSSELKAVLVMDGKVQKLESRIEEIDLKVDTQIRIDHGEQRGLQKAVSRKVHQFALDDDHKRLLFPEIYRDIKDRWGVPSYKDLPRKELQAVIRYIDAWHPRKVS